MHDPAEMDGIAVTRRPGTMCVCVCLCVVQPLFLRTFHAHENSCGAQDSHVAIGKAHKFIVLKLASVSGRFRWFRSSLPGRGRPNPISNVLQGFGCFQYPYHMLFPIQSVVSSRTSAARSLSLSLDML